MLREEARQVLGVEAGATPEEVRRAYLRAVRSHRPERDPEGFRRVREAFEVLRSGGEKGALPLPPWPAPDGDRPPVPGGDPHQVAPSPEPAGPEPSAETEAPSTLPESIDPVHAQDAGLALLRKVLEGPSAEELGAPVGLVLQAAIYGVEVGNLAGARRLVGELKGPFAEQLQALQRVAPHMSVRWRAVRELVSLPAEFPAGPRTAMARATMRLDFSHATPRLRDFQKRKPKLAAEAAEILSVHAPMLDEQFGDLLQPRQSVAYVKPAAGTLVLVALLFIVRFALHTVDFDDRREVRGLSPRPTAAVLARGEVFGDSVPRRELPGGLCDRDRMVAPEWECDFASEILDAVDAGDCQVADQRWEDFLAEREVRHARGERISNALPGVVRGYLFSGCAGTSGP